MIRRAVFADLPNVAMLLQEFNQVVTGTQSSLSTYGETLEALVDSGVVLVSDTDAGITGTIIGQVVDNPFFSVTLLQEVAWYATDNTGLALLRAFIAEARALNVDAVYLTVLDSAGERVHNIVQRRGFVSTERSYMMKL